jgi:uncharacterized protein (TIGR02271 family)
MNTIERIDPGTMVYGTDGVIGIVEGQAEPVLNDEPAEGVLVVRSHDGVRCYRVPATFISTVTVRNGQPAVELNVSSAVLESRLAEVRPAAGRAAASNPVRKEAASASEQETIRLPIHTEELDVRTQPITLGNVHVHKGVETVEQHLTVRVFREEAIIEHIAPEDYDATTPPGPDELILPVMEEKIFIEKRAVVKEYLRIRKVRVWEEQEPRATARHEFVEVTEQPSEGRQARDTPLFRVR